MRRGRISLAALVGFAVMVTVVVGGRRGTWTANSQSLDEVVAAFFPTELLEEVANGNAQGEEYEGESAFEVGDLGGDGATYVVAAYSSGMSGAVRVMRVDRDAPRLVDEYRQPGVPGGTPSVGLEDLDADGRPDIIVTFAVPNGGSTWIFRWESLQLRPIGPMEVGEGGTVYSVLHDVDFDDADGDGRVEIYVSPPKLGVGEDAGDTGGVWGVYALVDGKYAPLGASDSLFDRLRLLRKESESIGVDAKSEKKLLKRLDKVAVRLAKGARLELAGDPKGKKVYLSTIGQLKSFMRTIGQLENSGEISPDDTEQLLEKTGVIIQMIVAVGS